MNAALFTYMVSNGRAMFIYLSFILGGTKNLVSTDAGEILLFVFPFRDPKLDQICLNLSG